MTEWVSYLLRLAALDQLAGALVLHVAALAGLDRRDVLVHLLADLLRDVVAVLLGHLAGGLVALLLGRLAAVGLGHPVGALGAVAAAARHGVGAAAVAAAAGHGVGAAAVAAAGGRLRVGGGGLAVEHVGLAAGAVVDGLLGGGALLVLHGDALVLLLAGN